MINTSDLSERAILWSKNFLKSEATNDNKEASSNLPISGEVFVQLLVEDFLHSVLYLNFSGELIHLAGKYSFPHRIVD